MFQFRCFDSGISTSTTYNLITLWPNQNKHNHALVHVRTHTHTHSHSLSLTHTHTHTYTHTYTHTIYIMAGFLTSLIMIPLVMKYFYQCKYRFLLAFQGSLRAYLPANKVTKPGECRELVCMLYNLGWLEPYIYTVYRRMSDEISANNTVCIPFILYIYIYIFMVRADFDLIQDVP